jgi:hypothetical protein
VATRFTDSETGGLGQLNFEHPPGAFEPTSATRIALQTLGRRQEYLSGAGLDWGCGIGVLAIAAARIDSVSQMVGLDLNPLNVAAAITNAQANSVTAKTSFWQADSVNVSDPEGTERVAAGFDFVVANPPASIGDDGFGFRRRVMADVARLIPMGAPVFLSVSAQYGMGRVDALCGFGYVYDGLLGSTDAVPFDLERPDLLENLEDYAAEEQRGGLAYEFVDGDETASATEALAAFRATEKSPLSRWQVHLFRRA